MAKIILIGADGRDLGGISGTAEELLARAEQHARDNHLAKSSYFPVAVRQAVEEAGCRVSERDLAEAMKTLDSVRRGDKIDRVNITVSGNFPNPNVSNPVVKDHAMTSRPMMSQKFFETERSYPDESARQWYERLVGLDEHKRQLLLELELLLFHDRLDSWNSKHHRGSLRACQIMSSRAPLVLLEGDVGCGKTVLAQTIGDALATKMQQKVHLLKVNTQVRGSGLVGEMSDLIVQAFTQAEAKADSVRGEPVLLLIDEADALAAKRTDQHMHHEDKAGLNTLLQRIDGLRQSNRRIAVIFITNRPDALDPAIRRRSALRLTFGRPGEEMLSSLFRESLPELSLSGNILKSLVALTGNEAMKKYGATFTASDITDRLIPAALKDAYSEDRPLVAEDLLRHAKAMEPTPMMAGGGNDGE
ncbi:AAA family ATPase [Anatilimnocola sp. NA78]|uniref:AAA family ATPase n=1 Tax=Anatilimnocola sp. NA78 TaxID=3415683 RepID=UPI003CE56B81